jgi:Ras-related protein Rab-18
MASDDTPDHVFKLIVIGESAVGKTSIIFRYCKDTFVEDRPPTVGVGFQPKFLTMNEARIKLSIWDTAGQERFATLGANSYRNVDGALLVYDISRHQTLKDLEAKWAPQLEEHASANVEKLVVGNKTDLRQTEDADPASFVPKEEGEAFAKRQRALFVETSAKTAENVANAFEELTKRLSERAKQAEPASPTKVELGEPSGGESSSYACC